MAGAASSALERMSTEVRLVTLTLAVDTVQHYIKAQPTRQSCAEEPAELVSHIADKRVSLRVVHFHHELLREASVEPRVTLDVQSVSSLVLYRAVLQGVWPTCNIWWLKC